MIIKGFHSLEEIEDRYEFGLVNKRPVILPGVYNLADVETDLRQPVMMKGTFNLADVEYYLHEPDNYERVLVEDCVSISLVLQSSLLFLSSNHGCI